MERAETLVRPGSLPAQEIRALGGVGTGETGPESFQWKFPAPWPGHLQTRHSLWGPGWLSAEPRQAFREEFHPPVGVQEPLSPGAKTIMKWPRSEPGRAGGIRPHWTVGGSGEGGGKFVRSREAHGAPTGVSVEESFWKSVSLCQIQRQGGAGSGILGGWGWAPQSWLSPAFRQGSPPGTVTPGMLSTGLPLAVAHPGLPGTDTQRGQPLPPAESLPRAEKELCPPGPWGGREEL